MLEIDGSHGEGGGQILRTALALSCLTGTPFRIVAVRKGRPKPGLAPQHVAAVRAAQRISGAVVAGDAPGSLVLEFAPRGIRGGDVVLDIGTAGSTILVLQTVLPALALSGTRCALTIKGGTHVPFSPSFDYAAEVLVPALAEMGVGIDLSLSSCGFYPRGGGAIRAAVSPPGTLTPLRREERGRLLAVRGVSAAANLPRAIAERQRDAALRKVRQGLPGGRIPVDVEAREAASPGPGTYVFLRCDAEGGPAGFCALGARGKRAEEVGEAAAGDLLRHVAAGGALDPHLPDQLVPWLAMCPGESVLSTSRITRHLLTNLWTVGLFREVRYEVEGEAGAPGRLRLRPGSPGALRPGPS